MLGKSQHRKRKHSPQSKKGGNIRRLDLERRHSSTTAAQQQVVTQTYQPASHPSVSAPSVSAPTPMAKPTAVRYPYITTELRTIGILAGIILIILTILALVLS